ncbi:uncharacterized protein PG998_011614 [Apiospora kogelbergensis]|uniref:uncharacterized protein n=1 Tax=Apiospora kogelbergensis TaxID=1337665 RepID=UPI003131BDB6
MMDLPFLGVMGARGSRAGPIDGGFISRRDEDSASDSTWSGWFSERGGVEDGSSKISSSDAAAGVAASSDREEGVGALDWEEGGGASERRPRLLLLWEIEPDS